MTAAQLAALARVATRAAGGAEGEESGSGPAPALPLPGPAGAQRITVPPGVSLSDFLAGAGVRSGVG